MDMRAAAQSGARGTMRAGEGVPHHAEHHGGHALRRLAAAASTSTTRDIRTVALRMARSTTERLVWHCGAHTAKLESAPGGRFRMTKISCFLWPPLGRLAEPRRNRAF